MGMKMLMRLASLAIVISFTCSFSANAMKTLSARQKKTIVAEMVAAVKKGRPYRLDETLADLNIKDKDAAKAELVTEAKKTTGLTPAQEAKLDKFAPVPADPRVAFLQDVATLNKGNVVADLPKIVKEDAGEFKLVKDDSIKIEGNLKNELDAKLQKISVERIKVLISAVTKKGAKHLADDKLKGILDYKNKDDKADLKKAEDQLKFKVKDGEYKLAQLTDDQLVELNNLALEKAKGITEGKATSVTALNNEIKAVKEALEKFVTAQEKIVTDATGKASGANPKIVITPALTQAFDGAKVALTPEIGNIKFNKTKLKEVQAEHSRVTAVNFLAVEKKAVSNAAKAVNEFVEKEVAKQGGGAPVVAKEMLLTLEIDEALGGNFENIFQNEALSLNDPSNADTAVLEITDKITKHAKQKFIRQTIKDNQNLIANDDKSITLTVDDVLSMKVAIKGATKPQIDAIKDALIADAKKWVI